MPPNQTIYTQFPTADALLVNTNWNIQAASQFVVYLHNFMIAQKIVNSF